MNCWQRLKEFQDEFLDAAKDEVEKTETLRKCSEEDGNAARRQREGEDNENGH